MICDSRYKPDLLLFENTEKVVINFNTFTYSVAFAQRKKIFYIWVRGEKKIKIKSCVALHNRASPLIYMKIYNIVYIYLGLQSSLSSILYCWY